MANTRAIVKRRKSIQNIRKITRTMQLIATARYQGAMRRVSATRPYLDELARLIQQLSRVQEVRHPLLEPRGVSNRTVLIVLTSNRGLCSGYNLAVLREAERYVRDCERAGMAVDLIVSGRKGINYFEFQGRELATGLTVFEHEPRFEAVEPVAAAVMDAYRRRHVDSVRVTYTYFESSSRQQVQTIPLLPLQFPGSEEGGAPGHGGFEDVYDLSPRGAELLGDLLPQWVKLELFQCFIHAAVSEQLARMVAMKSATEAAGEMIHNLTQQYNRARQSQITLELLDIMGGAEALQ
jgi:F-type H+-transporting ATPase subunit gamma